jgi:hypothetical protein
MNVSSCYTLLIKLILVNKLISTGERGEGIKNPKHLSIFAGELV